MKLFFAVLFVALVVVGCSLNFNSRKYVLEADNCDGDTAGTQKFEILIDAKDGDEAQDSNAKGDAKVSMPLGN
jgi:hypothetical protein